MPSSSNRQPELLVLCSEPSVGQQLVRGLLDADLRPDIAATLTEARTMFFQKGGHDVLVLLEVPVALAERTTVALRALDPDLTVIAFGRELAHADLPACATRVPELHPASRAGVGTILKAIARLRS